VTFNDDASLDTSQVGDRRGIGGGAWPSAVVGSASSA
jgi:hypothetical protein